MSKTPTAVVLLKDAVLQPLQIQLSHQSHLVVISLYLPELVALGIKALAIPAPVGQADQFLKLLLTETHIVAPGCN